MLVASCERCAETRERVFARSEVRYQAALTKLEARQATALERERRKRARHRAA